MSRTNEPDRASANPSETGGTRPVTGVLASPAGRVLLAACLLELALIAFLVWLDLSMSSELGRSQARHRPAPASQRHEPYFRGNPGPWGDLEYVRIDIEPPDAFVPAEEISFPQTHWRFANMSPEQVTAFFQSCDLSPAQLAELANPQLRATDRSSVVVFPSDELILGLRQTARTQIYSVLATNQENDFHCWPFTYRRDGVEEWFQHSGLSDATLALTRSLLYPRGATLCFSDLPQVFARTPTVEERRRLLKTLSRHATLIMKLRVTPNTDIAALTQYWARGGRAKDVAPLLESLTKVPGGITVDVAHLIPPFARKRLNTFPEPPADPATRLPDCFWSAFNFFNDPPEERYYDDALWRAELERDYDVVDHPVLGDLIFLLRPDGSPLHAAVHIADDVVFTKNGGHHRQPWVLMKWADLVARYPEHYPVQTAIFRHKPPST